MVTGLPPALRHRDFRLLWLGLFVSVGGSMMQAAAILWHVREVSPDPIMLGLVGVMRVAPTLALAPLTGLVADHFNRRKLILTTQSGMALVAVALGLIAYFKVPSVIPIYTLAACSAVFGAFDLPARQALIPSLVPREDLPNAFSVNSIMFQTASILGPAIGGVVIGQFGLQWAYWLNAISFATIIIAILSMSENPFARKGERPEITLAAAVEGFRFVLRTPLILSSMMLDFVAMFFSSANTLLPIYARDILNVGAEGYGWLYAAEGVGAATAAILLAFVFTRIPRQGPTLFISVFMFGVATIWFGLSTHFISTFLALALMGAMDGVSVVIRNTIRQLATPDELRGRMVAVNMVFFQGGPQLGNLEAGLVAQAFGPVFSVVSGGVGCLLAVTWVARKWQVLWNYGNEMEAKAVAAD
jgi:MFS family permease